MSEPVMLCRICRGPIYSGEPVVRYDDHGFAHRFSTWCDHYKKQIGEFDEGFLADVGVTI